MAIIKPFRGLRPAPHLAAQVASLPYDVMDSEEARQLTVNNPYSFLRVTKSEVDLPPGTPPHSPQVYAQAKKTLERFIADKILIQDDQPHFYIYRQQMGDHIQIGLVAAASVAEYLDNKIKKHELTRPDKEQDRVNHIVATQAQTGAVFLTYKAAPDIQKLLETCMDIPPVYDFTSLDNIRHTLYVVDNPQKISAIEAAFVGIDALYVADGHHRSAAAARVYDACRKANPNHSGSEEYTRFLAVLFPHDMMYIMDYNRVVQDLSGYTPKEFLTEVQKNFAVKKIPSGSFKPAETHTFGMYLDGSWYQLNAKPESFNSANPVESLDVSILQNQLLHPLLGIEDPRTDKRIHFVGGIRGMKELEKMVDSGDFAVAFSLYPTSIEELMAIADAGKIMPPKSTWFEPKLRDAIVVHLTPIPEL